MKRTFLFAVILVVILGLVGCRPTQDEAPETTENELYSDWAGSEACAGCHPGNYNEWVNSGHPYKLNKVYNGQKPTYPYSTLPDIPNPDGLKDGDNTLGPPSSYSDVSFVIGGYNWKARFVDTNGYIITGSDTQHNYETGGWVGYHDDEVDKPYDCGTCHTSGYVLYEDGGVRKDDLPGMAGTFFGGGGIHCEECHGPAAVHVANGGGKDTVKIDTTAAECGRCHTRDSENRIAAKGGYIKHHEQYDELLGKNPDNMVPQGKHLKAGIGCNQCHDPHASVVNDDIAPGSGLTKACIDCHSDKAIVAGASDGISKPAGAAHAAAACIDCHMPKLTKTAVGHDGVGTQYQYGDIKTHIFKIDLTKTDDQQFTESGSFAYPWITGNVACRKCHNGVTKWDFHTPFGPGFTYKVHK